MINLIDCDIEVSKLKLQSHYYIHFWNTLGKSCEPAYHLIYWLNSITTVTYKNSFGIKTPESLSCH